MSASNATVWCRLAVYSTLVKRRHRMLCLWTSYLSVARWNRHGSSFGGRVVRRQQTLAGHLCMLVNDQWVTCGRAGTAWTRSSAWSAASAILAGQKTHGRIVGGPWQLERQRAVPAVMAPMYCGEDCYTTARPTAFSGLVKSALQSPDKKCHDGFCRQIKMPLSLPTSQVLSQSASFGSLVI